MKKILIVLFVIFLFGCTHENDDAKYDELLKKYNNLNQELEDTNQLLYETIEELNNLKISMGDD